MDFMFNWAIGISQIVGMSPAQVMYAVHDIKDGDPAAWREGFWSQGTYQLERAQDFIANKQRLAAGQLSMGAAYAYRASLQYTDPLLSDFVPRAHAMEQAFQQGFELMGVPMRAIEVPFEDTTLPGYHLEHDARTVDLSRIRVPSLFLMSEGEGAELRRQTLALHEEFRQRGVEVTLREFTAAEGADAHCQRIWESCWTRASSQARAGRSLGSRPRPSSGGRPRAPARPSS